MSGKLDSGTAKVVDMYSRHPFPFAGNHGNFFDRFVFPSITTLMQEYPIQRVLDAGCGTGNIIVDIAARLPEAEVVGVDVTDKSLEHAQQKAADRGLKNITFKKSNLLEYDPALGAFDFVYCQGVIHHLSDPLMGMRNLNRYLKPNHHAFVWLYGLLGRKRLLDLREALEVLRANDLPWDDRIKLARQARPLFLSQKLTFTRKIIKVLEHVDKHGGKGLFRLLFDRLRNPVSSTYVSDQLLHPQDHFYRFTEAVEMFSRAGFDFVRVLQGMSNTLQESFGDDPLLKQPRNLTLQDRYRLIELHEQPEGFGFLIKKVRQAS